MAPTLFLRMKFILVFFFASVSFAACNLRCPSHTLTKSVDGECYYRVEDLRHLIHGNCTNLGQSALGGFFPQGHHQVTITDLDDLQECTISLNIIDNTPPNVVGVRGSPSLLVGDRCDDNWKDVLFIFSKSDNCCGLTCNVTHVTYHDSDMSCCDRHHNDRKRTFGLENRDEEDLQDSNHHWRSCRFAEKQWEITGPRTVRLCAANRRCKMRTYTVTGMCTDTAGLSSTKTTTVVSTKRQCSRPDPHCRYGILKQNVCCPETCGSCGGMGCGTRPGQSQQCCGGVIRSYNRSCAHFPAPCIVH